MNGEALEKLKERCLVCTTCTNLVPTRTQVVFGEGDSTSPLMVIGEGPGAQEDLLGRPFVGAAGQMLNQALKENGIKREEVFITNTLKCRACDPVNGKLRNRPPTDLEVKNCRQWLIPQLEIIRPEVILCVGAPSAKNLIKRSFGITKERGLYFPCDYAKTSIATLHPAYILRNRSASYDGGFSLLVADVGKAWTTALQLREKKKSACTGLAL